MADQPRCEPYEESTFFDDDRCVRQVVDGTVPRGFVQEDTLLYTGSEEATGGAAAGEGDDGALPGGNAAEQEPAGLATLYPFPVTMEVLARGRERYNVNCTPCHGRLGNGDGIVVRRGYPQPASFHEERLREAPPGYFFNVITNGFGAMPSYAGQVEAVDRWAIAAYIQTLQLSQNATLEDVPADLRPEVEALEQEEIPIWPGAPTDNEDAEAEGSHP